jgi:hypothetical protein
MSTRTEILTLDDLEALLAKATPGEWRAGRSDMVSYEMGSGEPFKNVYVDDPRGKMHLGERLPKTVARGESIDCVENAQLIAASRNALPDLLRIARAVSEFSVDIQSWGSERAQAECIFCGCTYQGPNPQRKQPQRNGDGSPESDAEWEAYRKDADLAQHELRHGVEHASDCAWEIANRLAWGGK